MVEVDGVFRDGTMDESKRDVAENRQLWRVAVDGGQRLLPILADGEPDIASYWFGRETGIAFKYGRVGVISHPASQ